MPEPSIASHPTSQPATPAPTIVSVDMGYGHLRASQPLSDLFGVPVVRADMPPIADAEEQCRCQKLRYVHEGLSRLSRLPVGVGALMRTAFDTITHIEPLYSTKDLTTPDLGTRSLASMIQRGLGRG